MAPSDEPPASPKHTTRKNAGGVSRNGVLDPSGMSIEDIQKLVYELQVYRIELELQNEELRARQEELAQSRDRYLDLYDFAPSGYVTLDADTLIREANLMAAQLFGLRRSALVDRKLTEFVMPCSQDALYLHRQEVDRSGEKQSCELALRRDDGTLFAAQVVTVLTETWQGQNQERSQLYRCAITEIADRKSVDRAMGSQPEEQSSRKRQPGPLDRAIMGRELFIVELKVQVNELSRRLGLEAPYILDFLEDSDRHLPYSWE
jgi:PAS domain S-box-containing protein